MNIAEVREIIEASDLSQYEPYAEEIKKMAEGIKKDDITEGFADVKYLVVEDIQEALESFHRQCEDDKTIMRERARSERKRNSLGSESDEWDN